MKNTEDLGWDKLKRFLTETIERLEKLRLHRVSVRFDTLKIRVRMATDYDTQYDEIVITKEELKQIACNKAKDRYYENHWNTISADDNIEVWVNER